jgi:hypothetical protein
VSVGARSIQAPPSQQETCTDEERLLAQRDRVTAARFRRLSGATGLLPTPYLMEASEAHSPMGRASFLPLSALGLASTLAVLALGERVARRQSPGRPGLVPFLQFGVVLFQAPFAL